MGGESTLCNRPVEIWIFIPLISVEWRCEFDGDNTCGQGLKNGNE